jgi:penicillin-binding protein 1C
MKKRKKHLTKLNKISKGVKTTKTKKVYSKTGKKKVKKSLKRRFLTFRFLKWLILAGMISLIAVWLYWSIPLANDLESYQAPVSTKLYDRNGKLIYEIYADKKASPVALEDLPEHVKQATIAIEDKDFYRHHGISITGMTRAAYKTLFKQKLEGGSTLTQQLIKNALLTPERTVKRKIRELALTLTVETIYSKDKILELYLNQIPYGHTAYGIGAAAELYFGKEAKDLNLAEAALLSGLTAAPSRYSPFGSRPDMAKVRQEIVLRRMVEDNHITREQMDEPLEFELSFRRPEGLVAPHFALWVKELLAEKYGEAMVEKGGLRVTTTLDLELQELAQTAVATEVAKLKNQKVGNGAALVTRPGTGEILAMVGSKDYFATDEDGKVNIILSQRQPGSSIKPLNYAMAIENGKITASSVLADVPTCFITQFSRPYCPRNYDWGFRGPVQTRYALANSYNIPAVRVLALNGVEEFVDFASRMGITTFTDPSRYGLSLTLGGGEVTPYDMAVAFGVFANGGVKQPLTPFIKIEDWTGKVLEEIDHTAGERVLSQETSFIISDILNDNSARSAAFGSSSFLYLRDHPEASVKTGTTNDRRDNWTIGYTRHAVVLSWVGNNDNSSMSGAVSGVSGASPIWNIIIREVLDRAEKGLYSPDEEGHAILVQPKSVKTNAICINTGTFPAEDTECALRGEYFIEGFPPLAFTGGEQEFEFNRETGEFVDEETPEELREKRVHYVMYDVLGSFICLDCETSTSMSATIRYPLQFDSYQQQ